MNNNMGAGCTPIAFLKKGFLGNKSSLIITSDFCKRKAPGSSQYKFHYGVDLRCIEGTTLYAPCKCTINTVKEGATGGGLRICLETSDNGGTKFYIWYMHMHTCNFTSANIGNTLNEGDIVGTTGGALTDPEKIRGKGSTGAHLHLEIRKGANTSACAVDPKIYFLAKHQLSIKQPNGALIPYSANGYENGVNVYGQLATSKMFCSEDCLTVTNVMQGISLVNYTDNSIATPDNKETEKEPPKKIKVSNAQERLALGIWQITKLLIDSEVQDRQICDSSISLQTGSILNFFNKVCQQPFVEFMGDTYGNQYYWIVRRPPFDKEGMLRLSTTACRSINDNDIISRNLSIETGGIYSWYQYIPTGDVMGISEQTFICPAVFFPEYASVWGSKPLSVQSLYYSFIASGSYNSNKKTQADNNSRMAKAVMKDFRYLIESNAYRPFSRSGSVTIRGTRKIKRGTMIEFSDGEVFHVDSVSHSYNVTINGVNQTTTLQLSHGIYKNLINVDEANGKKYSYFNLIDFGDYDIKDVDNSNYQSIMAKWKVNKECFNYFLSREYIKS